MPDGIVFFKSSGGAFIVGAIVRSALIISVLLSGLQVANAAPRALYGKTVVVTWQEERQQKLPGEEEMRFVSAAAEFDVYVSEAGRPFSRLRMFRTNRRGKLRTGSRDAVGGEASARNVSFSGTTMSASMPRGAGGALLVSVTFDSGFQGCSARTVSGKASGVVAAHARSMISGKLVDLYSIKTSGEGCRIQDGNMFAQ